MNWEEIQEQLAAILDESLDELVDGARNDIQQYAKDLAKNMVYALRNERDDLRRELLGQARLLAEMNRIRLNRQARQALNRVLEVAVKVGKALLAGVV